MGKISFTKMHGAGNDYIYVDATKYPISNPSAVAVLLSDRHKGIGSDGLVLIDRSPVPEADFSMRIFNADGSEAMMCGNASRCIGKYLYERGLTDKTEIRLLTLSGIKTLSLHVSQLLPSLVGVGSELGSAACMARILANSMLHRCGKAGCFSNIGPDSPTWSISSVKMT